MRLPYLTRVTWNLSSLAPRLVIIPLWPGQKQIRLGAGPPPIKMGNGSPLSMSVTTDQAVILFGDRCMRRVLPALPALPPPPAPNNILACAPLPSLLPTLLLHPKSN